MIRLTLMLFTAACWAQAADTNRAEIDARVLASVPAKRHAALVLYAITDRDSTPAIDEKKAAYIDVLKSLIRDLLSTYYWHGEFPNGIDEAIEKRAVYQAGLWYPASTSTGASFYADLVRRYTVRMYEEEIVTIASAVSRRFNDPDLAIGHGNAQPFKTWKQAWDRAGDIKDGPNEPPEP